MNFAYREKGFEKRRAAAVDYLLASPPQEDMYAYAAMMRLETGVGAGVTDLVVREF